MSKQLLLLQNLQQTETQKLKIIEDGIQSYLETNPLKINRDYEVHLMNLIEKQDVQIERMYQQYEILLESNRQEIEQQRSIIKKQKEYINENMQLINTFKKDIIDRYHKVIDKQQYQKQQIEHLLQQPMAQSLQQESNQSFGNFDIELLNSEYQIK